MSDTQLFTNNAISLLEITCGLSDTTITLQPGMGAEFPQPLSIGDFFLVTLEDIGAPLQREIIKITGRTGDVLTIGARGQEGSTPRVWIAHNTLIDHRITAETIRQAFLQPVSSNLDIYGSQVLVEHGWTTPISNIIYSDLHRGHKYWVTIQSPTNGLAETFEVLIIVQGLLATNTESATWTISNRIGYKFLGNLTINLDVLSKTVVLSWTNAEPVLDVLASAVHI